MRQAQLLSAYLARNGFPTAQPRLSADPFVEDDEVTINDKVHVQVNSQLADIFVGGVVVENDDETFTFMDDRNNFAAILADLRSLS